MINIQILQREGEGTEYSLGEGKGASQEGNSEAKREGTGQRGGEGGNGMDCSRDGFLMGSKGKENLPMGPTYIPEILYLGEAGMRGRDGMGREWAWWQHGGYEETKIIPICSNKWSGVDIADWHQFCRTSRNVWCRRLLLCRCHPG